MEATAGNPSTPTSTERTVRLVAVEIADTEAYLKKRRRRDNVSGVKWVVMGPDLSAYMGGGLVTGAARLISLENRPALRPALAPATRG